LGGFSGSVFVDHLDRADPNKYKPGEKLNARIISVDPASQLITLSLLPHLVKFENVSTHLVDSGIIVGKVFEKVPVTNVAFGSSYLIGLAPNVTGFLHKIHTVVKEKESKKQKKLRKEAAEMGGEEGAEEAIPEVTQYTKVELEKG
jgi:hypothetical protein